jgi:hypothetical protein
MSFHTYIYITAKEKEHAKADLIDYYEVRKKVFCDKWNMKGYDSYPNLHDRLDSTIYLIIKATNRMDRKIVIGGRRFVFPEDNNLPSLNKYHVIEPKSLASRFQKGDHLKIEDVIPAVKVDKFLKYSEMGAFAIDQETASLLLTKEEYRNMRETVYRQSLDTLKYNGTDIAIAFAHRQNRLNQIKWLQNNGYDFASLVGMRGMFANLFPAGCESEALIVNVSNKYKLRGKEGILRFNQKAAQEARNRSMIPMRTCRRDIQPTAATY